jgi:hypothetical protein
MGSETMGFSMLITFSVKVLYCKRLIISTIIYHIYLPNLSFVYHTLRPSIALRLLKTVLNTLLCVFETVQSNFPNSDW